jgi:predicted dehydrogenase
MSKLQLGLVGCGGRGGHHLDAAVKSELFVPYAAADLDDKRRQECAAQFSFQHQYADYAQMLSAERGKIDVLHVCTQPTLRTPVAMAAIASGVKAIVMEKPREMTLSASRKLVEACQAAGVLLVVNHQTRFMTEWVALRKAVQEQTIGSALSLRSQCSNLLNQGTHMIDMAWQILGERPIKWLLGGADKRATGSKTHRGPRNALALVEFDGGVRGTFCFGDGDAPQFLPPGEQRYGGYNLEVRGSEGVAQAVLDHGYRRWNKAGELVESFESRWDGPNVLQAQMQVSRDVARALEDKSFKHPLRGESALVSMSAVEAICRSAVHGGMIHFPLIGDEDALDRWS